MNILIPDSWLREYLDTDATPKDIQKCLSLCGPSIERMHQDGNDWIYDVEITTNRVDCMSIYGLAREAAAILPQFDFRAQLKNLQLSVLTNGQISGLNIINDPKLCQRILALKVDHITIEPSPDWLQNRLIKVGLRPLNNLVDITNYVMWEIGHPTHVFDFDRLISKKMLIRLAKKNETVITLDEKKHTMLGGEVVIDDGTGKIIDLPSVMGTANSSVVETTKSALLFVDDIISSKVRFASMSHAIRTQAATLLEKDVDPHLSLIAMSRMVTLIKQIYPEVTVSNLIDIYPHPNSPTVLNVTFAQISSLIGTEISGVQIKNNLTRLGFEVKTSAQVVKVTPPSWRSFDVRIPEDVVEEIARLYGYHNIPPVLMAGSLPPPDHNQTFFWENRIKTALKYLGFNEIYSYSLVTDDTGLKLKNPLTSDWQFLRTSLLPSHLEIISHNQGKADVLNLFEIANVYLPRKNDLPEEQSRLIVTSTISDYYQFKGKLETLAVDLGIKHPDLDIKSTSGIFSWEVSLDRLLQAATETKTYTPISKFSPVIEDVNITITGSYSQLEKKIFGISNLINQIDLIDKYGPKLTLRLTYHSPTRQLSDVDVAPIREKIAHLS